MLENKYLSILLTARGRKLIIEGEKHVKWHFTIIIKIKLKVAADGLTFYCVGVVEIRLFYRLTKHGRCHGKCRPMQALRH